ncbi:hypothetical protein RVM26_04775 [Halomonas sp. KM072]
MQQESAAIEAIGKIEKALPKILEKAEFADPSLKGDIVAIEYQINVAIKDLDKRLKALENR